MKKLFLIIGAPGSGKTTDAELIAKENDNITHYSTGEMLRAEVATKSELGLEIDNYISKGLIVPIEVAIKTITNAIKNAPTDIIIIDGYPRSMEQLNALDEYLHIDSSLELASVIEVRVSEETARDRVLGRARGADDNTEVFDNRMKVYTEPLFDIQAFYNAKNLLHVISGEGTIETIVSEMGSFVKAKI
ncbi:Adenylate kinase [Sulfurimonas denitrificans DSM 1251]|uniref:Adenylate kinase n=1 Tax=Sulfurimonas denitrificans (strain ATCC 33889 / DSM 1251) TaxID=326298 RepID=Q30RL6_SULDN|nr:adenylate kinase [Sulfurimonas denitrificans]ABB44365.1 Adenylate kinase [Sulfurimonas denitrificans DSM 1251]MDD3441940.1 adenylate kinase [Sulfurimonas denitrificans]